MRDFNPGAGGDTIQLAGVGPSQVKVSDFRRPDILFQAPDNSVQIEILDGQQEFGGGAISHQQPSSYAVVGVGDFDGNGLDDILFRDPNNGTIVEYVNGTSETGGGVLQNNVFDASWSVVGIGDFNGDGKADIVWRRPTDGLVEIQLVNATTAVGGGAIAGSPFDASWSVVGVGDFNGDGKSDLLYRQASSGIVEIQLLNGNTGVGGGAIANSPFDASWSVVGVGDFNGDGKSDLVWQRASDGVTEIQLLSGTTAIGGGALSVQHGAGWTVAKVADFNGDGTADILWRDPSGKAYIDYINGTTVLGGGYIDNQLPANFSIVGVGHLDARTLVSYGSQSSVELLGVQNTSVAASNLSFVETGPAGGGTVSGGAGNDTLTGGPGNDTLVGNGGSDAYQIGRGIGQDTIINGLSTNSGATGELDFGSGIATNQLWLLHSGNDLQIDIMGTSSHVTVSNWFASPTAQLQKMTTSDGSQLDAQVNALVQAMATYSANNSGFDPTAVTQAPNDTTLQNAIAAAWHH